MQRLASHVSLIKQGCLKRTENVDTIRSNNREIEDEASLPQILAGIHHSVLAFPSRQLAPTSSHSWSLINTASKTRDTNPPFAIDVACDIYHAFHLHFRTKHKEWLGFLCRCIPKTTVSGRVSQIAIVIVNLRSHEVKDHMISLSLSGTHCCSHVLLGEPAIQDWAFGSSLAISQPREEIVQIACSTIRYSKQRWCNCRPRSSANGSSIKCATPVGRGADI